MFSFYNYKAKHSLFNWHSIKQSDTVLVLNKHQDKNTKKPEDCIAIIIKSIIAIIINQYTVHCTYSNTSWTAANTLTVLDTLTYFSLSLHILSFRDTNQDTYQDTERQRSPRVESSRVELLYQSRIKYLSSRIIIYPSRVKIAKLQDCKSD